ncbi:MAG: pilus assembly protein [Oscillospiraceae bacterium]|nr:pilus assembly protein [Oscillospiraceae bacterium]
MLKKKTINKKGQSIVEFALSLPILLTILCGIIDFGWIYLNKYDLDHAAFEGARCASVYCDSLDDDELRVKVADKVRGSVSTVRAEALIINLSSSADSFTVTVSYPVRTLTFVASTLFGSTYNATGECTSSAMGA